MRGPSATARPVSAREVIDALRVEAAEVTRKALALLPESREETGARLSCSASRVSQYVDAHHDATIRIHEAAALPTVAAVAIAEFVAGPAYLVVEVPSAGADLGDDMAHAIEAHREAGEAVHEALSACADGHITAEEGARLEREGLEAVHEALSACADGHITAEEGARLEREGLEAVRALLRLVELGRRAQRERVIAARRLGVAR